ncbi:MAG TPA: hypothetical protein VNW97_05455 [Candidatus Saccharimonadales bacterium]|jgi:hypothetical protein|nr:hypothetical protein [Candidatus Saccharimonadales bacterium]
MVNNRLFHCCVLVLGLQLSCGAQLLSVTKIKDPYSQSLQQKYAGPLQQLSGDAAGIHFPFPFYFSQTLDVDEVKQKQMAQGSIHFDRFNGQEILQITGNYYASYSATAMSAGLRARQTFQEVVLPLLKLSVADLDRSIPFDAYAFEIAHHVRKKVYNVNTEGPENVVFVFSRGMGEKLAKAKGDDVESQQAALLESDIWVNGEPITLWLVGDDAPVDVKQHHLARYSKDASTVAHEPTERGSLVNPRYLPSSELLDTIATNAKAGHDTSPARLLNLQREHQPIIDRITKEMTPSAKLVDYAPPSFIAFHGGVYLQMNVATELEQPAGTSQYKIAALAFDQHISHLLRPVTKYFNDKANFEGVDFSTTVHQQAQPNSVAVEFIFPMSAVQCYAKYDCSGQELINRGLVLINGERVTLDLIRAESDGK